MDGIVGNRSYAFLTAYLLGVEKKALQQDYIEDFVYSEGLEFFKRVPNANILRALSRVKQGILHYYDCFKNTQDLETASKGNIDADLKYLLENNIDLYNTFRSALDISAVMNDVTNRINRILPGVLEELNFMHIPQVSCYFYMYEVTEKTLTKLVTSVKGRWLKFPHGIAIVRGDKALQHLPYLLKNDKNLILCSYAITNTPYNLSTIIIPQFNWSSYEISSSTPDLPITKPSIFYVDCDNVDFFMFLSTLESLKKTSSADNPHIIKLYLDSMTSPIWRFADKFSEGNFQFELIEVTRLKEAKSVVDIVIAAHMTKDSLEHSNKMQGVVSSDSDFFGIVESGITMFVLYDGKCVSQDYISYLKRKKLINFDISSLSTSASRSTNEKAILTHLCLSYLAEIPMLQWNPQVIVDLVLSGFPKDIGYGMTIQKDIALSVAHNVLEHLEVKHSKNAIHLSSSGVEVTVPLKIV